MKFSTVRSTFSLSPPYRHSFALFCLALYPAARERADCFAHNQRSILEAASDQSLDRITQALSADVHEIHELLSVVGAGGDEYSAVSHTSPTGGYRGYIGAGGFDNFASGNRAFDVLSLMDQQPAQPTQPTQPAQPAQQAQPATAASQPATAPASSSPARAGQQPANVADGAQESVSNIGSATKTEEKAEHWDENNPHVAAMVAFAIVPLLVLICICAWLSRLVEEKDDDIKTDAPDELAEVWLFTEKDPAVDSG